MEQVFFRVPFASTGDTLSIPEPVTDDGSVNWQQGWSLDYEKDMDADANAKAVEREVMNFMFNAITVALRQYQTAAFPEFITAADNGGKAYTYAAGTVVRYRASSAEPFSNYVSLVDNNTATPGTDPEKWQAFIFAEATAQETKAGTSATAIITPRRLKGATDDLENKIQENLSPFILPVGAVILWGNATPPEGWLEMNGQAFDKNKNPKLADIYPSGRLPDWRGRVPRGWANGSAVDSEPGRAIGSFQEDAIVNIKGNFACDVASTQAVGRGVDGVFRDVGWLGTPADKGSVNNQEVRKIEFDASRVVKTASEVRVRNVAVMFIVKTDQSESDNSEAVPTALIVTPTSAVIEQGATQRCTASVLPAALEAAFPVTWSVADDTLGTIDADGNYNAHKGVAGTQTVIASISTGLSATITITQHIFLESLEIKTIPPLSEDAEAYSPAIIFTPTNYTEPLEYSSADNSVATFSGGNVYPAGQGSTLISLKGTYSGVSASQTVKVTAAEVAEEFFRIENNLLEVAEAGEDAQAEARENLGLGELATRDSLNAADVGAALMAKESLPAEMDLNELTTPGDYFQSVSSYATEANNYPEETAGAVRVVVTGVSDGACRQFYWPYNSTKEYRRCGYGLPLMFSAWDEY